MSIVDSFIDIDILQFCLWGYLFISTTFLDFIPLPPPPSIQTPLTTLEQHLPLIHGRPLQWAHSKISFLIKPPIYRYVTIDSLIQSKTQKKNLKWCNKCNQLEKLEAAKAAWLDVLYCTVLYWAFFNLLTNWLTDWLTNVHYDLLWLLSQPKIIYWE